MAKKYIIKTLAVKKPIDRLLGPVTDPPAIVRNAVLRQWEKECEALCLEAWWRALAGSRKPDSVIRRELGRITEAWPDETLRPTDLLRFDLRASLRRLDEETDWEHMIIPAPAALRTDGLLALIDITPHHRYALADRPMNEWPTTRFVGSA